MVLFYFWIIVQILVESLPISSSGHQILFEKVFNFYPDAYFFSYIQTISCHKIINISVFEHALHAPTVIVLMIFFARDWIFLLRNMLRFWPIIIRLVLLSGFANCITVLLFLFFKSTQFTLPLGVNFLITGCLLLSLLWCDNRKKMRTFDVSSALLLGFVQGLALMPGISRFAIVLVVARWLGFSSRKAFKVTFMIQWPLIAAASLRGMYVLGSCGFLSQLLTFNFILIIGIATVLAYFLLCVVARLNAENKLWWFGLYMCIPALVALVC